MKFRLRVCDPLVSENGTNPNPAITGSALLWD